MLVGRRMFDLFHDADAARKHEVHPELLRYTREMLRRLEMGGGARLGPRRPRPRGGRVRCAPRWSSGSTARALLPAILFIFSRAGCDAAVQQCLAAGLRLTTPEERAEIRRVVERGSPRIPGEDLAVLGYWEWLDGLERGLAAHHAGHAAGVQGGRRGAVRPRAGQGGLRHRDAGAGHQHAGPLRGAGAAGQVQRRGARRPDAGGVHPAHRPGRPARHRRRGPRRGGVVAGGRPAARRRARLDPHLPAAVELPARRTTWPSTWSARSARTAPASCWSRRSRSSRRTGRWSAWPGRCSATRRRSRRTARRRRATTATSTSTSRCGWRSPTGSARWPGRAQTQRRAAAVASLERLRVGDVIRVPSGRRAGLAVVLDPGAGGFGEPRPLVLTEDRWAGRVSLGRLHRRRSRCWPGSGCPSTSTTARRRRAATWPPRSAAPAWTGTAAARPAAAGADRRGPPARRAARRSCAGTPATPARSGRSTPAGPSGGCRLRARHRGAARAGGQPHRVAGPHVRPGLRAARRARLPRPATAR